MSGQVECYGQSFLSAGQVAAVECVTLLSRRETCILADGPRTERIHHAIGTTQEGRDTCSKVQVLHAFKVLLGIYGLDINLLGSLPVGSDTILLLPLLAVLCLYAGKDIYVFK